ncbi:Cilia- and flagella-associated protein 57, partial [Gryllus bimaculatus]
LHRDAATLDRNDEDVNRQIEDDADREITEMKTLYEGKLKEERETIVKLRAEAGQMRKKYIGSQKEIEYYKQQIAKLHGQHQKVLKLIGSHDRAISDLKREMQERDATIPEK